MGGAINRRYLVKFDVCSVPQLFVVAKDRSVLWFGDVMAKGVEVRVCVEAETTGYRLWRPETAHCGAAQELIRSAVAADNVELEKPDERDEADPATVG